MLSRANCSIQLTANPPGQGTSANNPVHAGGVYRPNAETSTDGAEASNPPESGAGVSGAAATGNGSSGLSAGLGGADAAGRPRDTAATTARSAARRNGASPVRRPRRSGRAFRDAPVRLVSFINGASFVSLANNRLP